MSFECKKCGATFQKNQGLQRHLARKRPCDPVLDRERLPVDKQNSPNKCRYCGRVYSCSSSVSRHLKSCQIANSEDGMEKLYEHALKRQEEVFAKELEKRDARLAEMEEQLRALTLSAPKAPGQPSLECSTQAPPGGQTPVLQCIGVMTNNGPVTNYVTNNIQASVQVNVVGFDREDRIHIPAALVKAAFTENPRLAEYCRLDDSARTNAERAAPYVLEALVDLVRRAHRDPLYRNVYLNPKRADQVLVLVEEKDLEGQHRWEIRTLVDAIRLLFDGVASNLHKIVVTDQERTALPIDVQSAASWVPNLYEDEPDKFVKEGKAPMAAHLQNTRPSLRAGDAFDIMSLVVSK